VHFYQLHNALSFSILWKNTPQYHGIRHLNTVLQLCSAMREQKSPSSLMERINKNCRQVADGAKPTPDESPHRRHNLPRFCDGFCLKEHTRKRLTSGVPQVSNHTLSWVLVLAERGAYAFSDQCAILSRFPGTLSCNPFKSL